MFMPDFGSEFSHPGSRGQKTVSKLSEKCCGMFIPDPDFSPARSQGSTKHRIQDSGSGSATLGKNFSYIFFQFSVIKTLDPDPDSLEMLDPDPDLTQVKSMIEKRQGVPRGLFMTALQ